jgi:hypothetical protein
MVPVVKPEEINLLENLAVDGRVILKWKLKQPDGRVWRGLICLCI